MNKQDGGPAFPIGEVHPNNVDLVVKGMSLLDYFAAAALTGLLASRIAMERGQTSDDVAAIAYRTADAMLAQRSKE